MGIVVRRVHDGAAMRKYGATIRSSDSSIHQWDPQNAAQAARRRQRGPHPPGDGRTTAKVSVKPIQATPH